MMNFRELGYNLAKALHQVQRGEIFQPVDFKAKSPSGKRKSCNKGYPCKGSCISTRYNCKNALSGQSKSFAKWVQGNLGKLTTNQKKAAKAIGIDSQTGKQSKLSKTEKDRIQKAIAGDKTIKDKGAERQANQSAKKASKEKKSPEDIFKKGIADEAKKSSQDGRFAPGQDPYRDLSAGVAAVINRNANKKVTTQEVAERWHLPLAVMWQKGITFDQVKKGIEHEATRSADSITSKNQTSAMSDMAAYRRVQNYVSQARSTNIQTVADQLLERTAKEQGLRKGTRAYKQFLTDYNDLARQKAKETAESQAKSALKDIESDHTKQLSSKDVTDMERQTEKHKIIVQDLKSLDAEPALIKRWEDIVAKEEDRLKSTRSQYDNGIQEIKKAIADIEKEPGLKPGSITSPPRKTETPKTPTEAKPKAGGVTSPDAAIDSGLKGVDKAKDIADYPKRHVIKNGKEYEWDPSILGGKESPKFKTQREAVRELEVLAKKEQYRAYRTAKSAYQEIVDSGQEIKYDGQRGKAGTYDVILPSGKKDVWKESDNDLMKEMKMPSFYSKEARSLLYPQKLLEAQPQYSQDDIKTIWGGKTPV